MARSAERSPRRSTGRSNAADGHVTLILNDSPPPTPPQESPPQPPSLQPPHAHVTPPASPATASRAAAMKFSEIVPEDPAAAAAAATAAPALGPPPVPSCASSPEETMSASSLPVPGLQRSDSNAASEQVCSTPGASSLKRVSSEAAAGGGGAVTRHSSGSERSGLSAQQARHASAARAARMGFTESDREDREKLQRASSSHGSVGYLSHKGMRPPAPRSPRVKNVLAQRGLLRSLSEISTSSMSTSLSTSASMPNSPVTITLVEPREEAGSGVGDQSSVILQCAPIRPPVLARNLSGECVVRCNRQELDELLKHPQLPDDAYEKLFYAAQHRRPTKEIAQLTKEIMIDKRTPLDVAQHICRVVQSSTASVEKLVSVSEYEESEAECEEGLTFEHDIRRNGVRGRSLFLFSPKGRVRNAVARFVVHPAWAWSLTFLVVFNAIAFMCLDPLQVKGKTPRDSVTEAFVWVDTVSICLFLLDYLLKMFAAGVFFGPHTLFGRHNGRWFLFDFFIVVACFAFLTGGGSGAGALGIIRTFRAIRPLHCISHGIRTIIDSLMQSMSILADSVSLLVLSLMLWGIAGYHLFHGTLFHRCALCENGVGGAVGTVENCTGAIEANPPLYCYESQACPGEMSCVEFAYLVFPYKYANYDNCASAMLAIFQVISYTAWNDLLVVYKQAGPDFISITYFTSIVCFIGWLILGLFVAVINTVFTTIRSRSHTSGFGDSEDYRFLLSLGIIPKFLMRWLKKGEDAAAAVATATRESVVRRLSGGRGREDDDVETPPPVPVPPPLNSDVAQHPPKPKSDAFAVFDNVEVMSAKSDEHGDRAGADRAAVEEPQRSRFLARVACVVGSVRFELAVNGLILVNLMLQCTRSRDMSKGHTDVLNVSEHVFAIIFAVEIMLKVAALQSLELFLRRKSNVFDLVLVLVSLVSLYAADRNLTFLQSVRAFRVVRLLHTSSSLRALVENSLRALTPALNVIVLFLFGMVLFAGMGKQLLAGERPSDMQELTRHNFDTFGHSLVTLFVIMTSDNWFTSMYRFMEPDAMGPAICIYFLCFYIWAVWIMLSLFTVVVLEAFDLSQEQKLERIKKARLAMHMSEQQDQQQQEQDQQLQQQDQQQLQQQPIRPSLTHSMVTHRGDSIEQSGNCDTLAESGTYNSLPGGGAPLPVRRRSSDRPPRTSFVSVPLPPDVVNSPVYEDAAAANGKGGVDQRNPLAPGAGTGSDGGGGGAEGTPDALVPDESFGDFRCPHSPGRKDVRPLDQVPEPELGFSLLSPQYSSEGTNSSASSPQNRASVSTSRRSKGILKMGCSRSGISPLASNADASNADCFSLKRVSFAEETENCSVRTGRTSSADSRIEDVASPRPSAYQSACDVATASEMHDMQTFLDPTTHRLLWEREQKPSPVEKGRFAGEQIGGAAVRVARTGRTWRGHMSLWLFTPNNVVRLWCVDACASGWFEYGVVCGIAVSCTTAVLRLYVSTKDALKESEDTGLAWSLLTAVDWLVVTMFILEAAVKIVAKGFAIGEEAYWHYYWNRFDFTMLLLMVGVAPHFALARALRPMRLMRRLERVRTITTAFLKSIPMLMLLCFASFYVILLFGLIGQELFSGLMDACTDLAMEKADCVGEYEAGGVLRPRVWRTPILHFDNMFASMFALWQIASLSSWSDTMYRTMDITGLEEAPRMYASPMYALFFVVYILISSFFLINIFVGVIVMSINIEENTELLTDEQRNWRSLRTQLMKARPLRNRTKPESRLRRACFQVVEFPAFPLVITACLVAYGVVSLVRHHDEPDSLTTLAIATDHVVMAVFAAEAVLKIAAYTPQEYFYDHWNKYDFVMITGNIVCTAVVYMVESSAAEDKVIEGTFGFWVCFFKIGRHIRLVKQTDGVRFLLETLLKSLTPILHALVMFVLLLFSYAILGNMLFGAVKFQRQLTPEMNFRTFANSLLILFKVITGDAWNDIMWDCSVQPPYCTTTAFFDDCGPPTWATRYASFFVSLLLLQFFCGVQQQTHPPPYPPLSHTRQHTASSLARTSSSVRASFSISSSALSSTSFPSATPPSTSQSSRRTSRPSSSSGSLRTATTASSCRGGACCAWSASWRREGV